MNKSRASIRFYVGYILVLMAIVLGVERLFGTLYARYVIVYTGAIFMVGLLMGRRYEQAWLAQRSASGTRVRSVRDERPAPTLMTGSEQEGPLL